MEKYAINKLRGKAGWARLEIYGKSVKDCGYSFSHTGSTLVVRLKSHLPNHSKSHFGMMNPWERLPAAKSRGETPLTQIPS